MCIECGLKGGDHSINCSCHHRNVRSNRPARRSEALDHRMSNRSRALSYSERLSVGFAMMHADHD